MDQLIGVFGGLGAMFSWGVANFLSARASRETSSLQVAFISRLLGFSIILILYLLFVRRFEITAWALGLVGLASLAVAIALFSFFKAMEIGPVSVTNTIGSAYSMVTVFITVKFLGDSLSLNQWLAVFMIFVGILLASLQREKLKARLTNKEGLKFALVAMFAWGISFALFGIAVRAAGWFLTTLLQYAFAAGWLAVLFGLRGGVRRLWGTGVNKEIFLLTVLGVLGTFSINFGFERDLVSIVTPISSASPAVTSALALIFLKERIQRNQLFGVALIIFGLVLLAVK